MEHELFIAIDHMHSPLDNKRAFLARVSLGFHRRVTHGKLNKKELNSPCQVWRE